MNHDSVLERERARWAILLIIAIVIFTVDSFSLERQTKESAPNVSEGAQQADELRNEQKESKDSVQEQITYNGDQVWRIYKNNSFVDELVKRYDEHGCT